VVLARGRRYRKYGRGILGGAFTWFLVILAFILFLLWKWNNDRMDQMQMVIAGKITGIVDVVAYPLDFLGYVVDRFTGLITLSADYRRAEHDIAQMEEWKDRAMELEFENAKLRALNNMRSSNVRYYHISGEVISRADNAFSRSAIINVGRKDGIIDGIAVTDGYGMVGRIFGVGEDASRVLLVEDINSKIAVQVLPSGMRAILVGKNKEHMELEFLVSTEGIQKGDRVLTSGDENSVPAGISAGVVTEVKDDKVMVAPVSRVDSIRFVRLFAPKDVLSVIGDGCIIQNSSSLN